MTNKKYFFILLFLIVAIGSLTAVSAGDTNQTDSQIASVDEIADATDEVAAASDVSDSTNQITASDVNSSDVLADDDDDWMDDDLWGDDEGGDDEGGDDEIDSEITIFEYNTYAHEKVIKFKLTDLDGDPLPNQDICVDIYRRGYEDEGADYFDTLTTNANGVATLKWTSTDLGAGYFTIVASGWDTEAEDVTLNNVRVLKKTVLLRPARLVTGYGSGSTFKVRAVDSAGNAVAGIKVMMRFYTGNKVIKTVVARTNAYGYAVYKASTLPLGFHKVLVSNYDSAVVAKSVISAVKVVKMPVLVLTRNVCFNSGAEVHIGIMNKATQKALNGVKLNIRVYTGSRYKSYYVTTAYDGKMYKSNGIACISTNALTKGNHIVKIIVVSAKYYGVGKGILRILPSAKTYPSYTALISGSSVRYTR